MTTDSSHRQGTIPTWDEKSASFPEFELKLKFYKLGTKKDDRYLCASRVIQAMPLGSQQFKLCAQIDEDKLLAADGSGIQEIVKILSSKKVVRTVQEAVRLLEPFIGGATLYRQKGESMRS